MISGPKIQAPQTQGDYFTIDEGGESLTPTPVMASFLASLGKITFYATRSGTTAERPSSSSDIRWVGMPFMDTSLGKPVFLKIASTNVWVDGSGAIV